MSLMNYDIGEDIIYIHYNCTLGFGTLQLHTGSVRLCVYVTVSYDIICLHLSSGVRGQAVGQLL